MDKSLLGAVVLIFYFLVIGGVIYFILSKIGSFFKFAEIFSLLSHKIKAIFKKSGNK